MDRLHNIGTPNIRGIYEECKLQTLHDFLCKTEIEEILFAKDRNKGCHLRSATHLIKRGPSKRELFLSHVTSYVTQLDKERMHVMDKNVVHVVRNATIPTQ
jgi:hypothetical protein